MLRAESSAELRDRARRFRREPTEAEDLLWEALRGRRFRDLKFRRQRPVGPFIADFYCLEHRLVVEVDGGVHDQPDMHAHDVMRADWLANRAVRIVRVPASLVLQNLEEALSRIASALEVAIELPDHSSRNGE